MLQLSVKISNILAARYGTKNLQLLKNMYINCKIILY